MFKNLSITYRAILFAIAIIFMCVFFVMFTFHVGTSILEGIKYKFFRYKTIYIVTDLDKDDQILSFTVSYIKNQIQNKYEYKLLDFDQCEKISQCIKKVGIILAKDPDLVYKFKDYGFIELNNKVKAVVESNNCVTHDGVTILHNNKDKTYYYAVGQYAPFDGMLISLPINIISMINY